jgi:hypothetical protein
MHWYLSLEKPLSLEPTSSSKRGDSLLQIDVASKSRNAEVGHFRTDDGPVKSFLLIIVATCLGLTNIAGAQASDGAPALAKLQGLTGNWEGTFAWSGARTASGKMNATYYGTGNGSAIVENLIVDWAPMMTSVYHLDGANLRGTHFCAAQNQPRLKATLVDLAQGVIKFSLVDVTNLRSPDAGYVHGLEVRLLDPNHITLDFLFEGGGKQSTEQVDLKRAH